MLTLALTLVLSARLDSPVTERVEALAKETLAKSNEPRAAAPLIRLRELLDEVDDLNLLAEPLNQLLSRRGTDPFVRTLAQRFLADVERARGRTVKASEILAEFGFVRDWYLVGSFDNEGKSGCDTDYGPESAIDLKATYPAAGREVGWRKPEAHAFDGFVDLSVSLRPNSGAVGYALSFLEVDAETRAALSLGVSGGFRLFINGVKVAGDDRYNLPRMDQRRVEVRLRKGLNRVLLKVCQAGGPYGFYLRARGPKGPLSAKLPDTVPLIDWGSAPAPTALPTLAETLERQLKANPANAELRADYATVLAHTRAYPDTEKWPEREAERAVLQKPQDVELALVAAGLADDVNDKRAHLTQALVLAPRHPWARLKMAQLELGREHPEVALKAASALLQDFPRFAPAWDVKLRSLMVLGEKVAALRAAEESFTLLASVPSIAREAVSASRRADRLDEAAGRTRAVLGLRFDDLDARRGLAALLADLGRVDEAVQQYEKVLALDPFDSASLLRLAELLAANGRLAASKAAFARVRALAPDEPEVHEREGRSLLHAGEKDAALLAFQRSLFLRPQNPALKELVRTLRGEEAGAGSVEAFPLERLLAEAKSLKDDDAVILADVKHVRVQTSGLSSRFEQLVVKVLSSRGVESYRTIPITWTPDRQEVRVVKARITKPDGSIVESYAEQDHPVRAMGGHVLRHPLALHHLPGPGAGRRARGAVAARRHDHRQPPVGLLGRRGRGAVDLSQETLPLRGGHAGGPTPVLEHHDGAAWSDGVDLNRRRPHRVPLRGERRGSAGARAADAGLGRDGRNPPRVHLPDVGAGRPVLPRPRPRSAGAQRRAQAHGREAAQRRRPRRHRQGGGCGVWLRRVQTRYVGWSSASTATSHTGSTACWRGASATARTRRRSCHAMLKVAGVDSRLVLLRMRRPGRAVGRGGFAGRLQPRHRLRAQARPATSTAPPSSTAAASCPRPTGWPTCWWWSPTAPAASSPPPRRRPRTTPRHTWR